MANDDEKASPVKSIALVCTTLIAIASLILNYTQYRSALAKERFEVVKSYPSVEMFRLTLTGRDVHRVRRLAEKGAQFSLIPNPSFIDDGTLASLASSAAAKIEFAVFLNRGASALSDVAIRKRDGTSLRVAHVAAGSSLLVPVSVAEASALRPLGDFAELTYNFDLGGHRLDGHAAVPPRAADVIVFEAGLGALKKGNYDFEKED
jgi:hypothetical protein